MFDTQSFTPLFKEIERARTYRDRKRINAAVRKLLTALAEWYPKPELEQVGKALRESTRFAHESGSNELEEVQISERFWNARAEMMDAGTVDSGWVRRLARADREVNILPLWYQADSLQTSYRTFCRYWIGRTLVRLLLGRLGTDVHGGEALLRELWFCESPLPTREDAERFVHLGGMREIEPASFLAHLVAEMPGGGEANDLLLSIYNALVRVERLQQQANEQQRARRGNGTSGQAPDPVLMTTRLETQLRTKGRDERARFAAIVAPYLFDCTSDHLAKVVAIPQKWFRQELERLAIVEGESCHTHVVTRVEDPFLFLLNVESTTGEEITDADAA